MLFQGVAHLSLDLILAGIIWTVALGFAAGNYACSLVHRLPRNRGVLSDKPYCGHCRTPLATKDLFPVVSALMLKHRCRYCGTPFPTSHTWTEVLVGLLFAFSFLQFGFSEHFLLSVFLGTFLIILASIENNEGYLQKVIMVSVAVTGMLLRTLADGTLYGFLIGGFFGVIVGAIIWHRRIEKAAHNYRLPDGAKLTALGGICAGTGGLGVFLCAFLLFFITGRMLCPARKPLPKSIPFGMAVMLPVLFPSLADMRVIMELKRLL